MLEEGNTDFSKVAVVTVGDEIVFGERNNENQKWMCHLLWERGLPASVTVSLPDDVLGIARWIKLMKDSGHNPIFVSGGLGGTHDDCTREGIALGIDVPLVKHEQCDFILSQRYGENYNEQRKRMSLLPQGSSLLENKTGAPGFTVSSGNSTIYAFPGFPSMMRVMMESVVASVFPEKKEIDYKVKEFTLPVSEVCTLDAFLIDQGAISSEVEEYVKTYPEASVGIYPSDVDRGRKVLLRLRVKDRALIKPFEEMMQKKLAQFDNLT